MTEHLTNVQVQYFTPPEFAEEVRLAIIDDMQTQQAVAEMLKTTQTAISGAISEGKKEGGAFRFKLLARIYEIVTPCYEVGRTHNGNVFVVWGEVETGHKTDDSPLVPFRTADGGEVGISQNLVDKLGL